MATLLGHDASPEACLLFTFNIDRQEMICQSIMWRMEMHLDTAAVKALGSSLVALLPGGRR